MFYDPRRTRKILLGSCCNDKLLRRQLSGSAIRENVVKRNLKDRQIAVWGKGDILKRFIRFASILRWWAAFSQPSQHCFLHALEKSALLKNLEGKRNQDWENVINIYSMLPTEKHEETMTSTGLHQNRACKVHPFNIPLDQNKKGETWCTSDMAWRRSPGPRIGEQDWKQRENRWKTVQIRSKRCFARSRSGFTKSPYKEPSTSSSGKLLRCCTAIL